MYNLYRFPYILFLLILYKLYLSLTITPPSDSHHNSRTCQLTSETNKNNQAKRGGKVKKTFCKFSRWSKGWEHWDWHSTEKGVLVCVCGGGGVAPNNIGDSWDTVVHGQHRLLSWLLGLQLRGLCLGLGENFPASNVWSLKHDDWTKKAALLNIWE